MFIVIANKKQIFLFGLLVIIGAFLTTKIYNYSPNTATFSADSEKYIVLIIDDYGYGGEGTEEMMNLGVPITAAIMPGLEFSLRDSQNYFNNGHEIILHQPMEPVNGNKAWLGPSSITGDLSEEEILNNLKQARDSIDNEIGMNNHMGSKIMQDNEIIKIIFKFVKENDLIFVDSKTATNSEIQKLAQEAGIIYFARDVFLDNTKDIASVEKQLAKAYAIAEKQGYAICIGHVGNAGGKVTVEGIRNMIPGLQAKGVKFVTISELSAILNGDGEL